MNILFLFISYPEKITEGNLTKYLSDEFLQHGDGVYVATIREKRHGLETSLSTENGANILRIKTKNMFGQISKVEKFISIMTIHGAIAKEIIKFWPDVHFDIIVGTSPYMSQKSLIFPLKTYYECPSFLILWDLFPQNAKDLELIKSKYLFKYLKRKEKDNLRLFDFIGCQSSGNLEYMKDNYKYLDINSLHFFPQWAIINKLKTINKLEIRNKYNFKEDDFLFVFGGNMGIPQNLTSIIDVAYEIQYQKKIKFIFIGNGTEKRKLVKKVEDNNMKNVIFFDQMDRIDYQNFLYSCDVGVISLDPRFTFPNFPSKILDYLKYGLPIIASLDKFALYDAGNLIENQIQAGLVSNSNNNESFKENVLKLFRDDDMCKRFSLNGRKYFENNFNVKSRYYDFKKIINK